MANAVTPGRPLTGRQAEVLRLIVAGLLAGRAPTTREIAAGLGITSPNGVVCHLRALVQRGLIQVTSRNRRLGGEGGPATPSRWRGFRLAGACLVLQYTDDEAGRRLREAVEGGEVEGG